MSEKYNKSAAKTVLIVMLIIELIIVLTVFALTISFKNADSTPSLLGYSFYISDEKDMDSAVEKGSLVVTKNCTVDSSHVGCVMLCENVEGFGTSIFRLTGVEATNETLMYNMCFDDEPNSKVIVSADVVIGECKYSYHTLGKLITFVTSKIGVVVCVIFPALIFAIIELILGFVKEMKKRELQKKRQRVREEQAREHSTKQRRTHSKNVREFAEEDKRLKNIHRHKKGELPNRLLNGGEEPVKADDRTRIMDKPKETVEERTKVIERPEVNNVTSEVIDESVVNIGAESRLRVRQTAEKQAREKKARLEKTAAIEAAAREEIKAELERVIKTSEQEKHAVSEAEPVVTSKPEAAEPVAVAAAPAPKPQAYKPRASSAPSSLVNVSLDDLMKMIDSEHEKLRKSVSDK